MEAHDLPSKHQIYHNRGFYYFAFFIPVTLIYAAVITFYHRNKFIPYFEEVGINLPEKRLIEAGFNVCAWIMLTALLITDGAIQTRNQKIKSILHKSKNNFSFSLFRFLECIFGGLTFLSCIAYGSILISDSIKYHYIFGILFLISSSLYFLFVNLMFSLVKMNTKKEITINDKSNIGLIDWIHAIIGPMFFVLSYLMKCRFILFQNKEVNNNVSKLLQYIGITLLFFNFVRILLRMPVINIFLAYKKKE